MAFCDTTVAFMHMYAQVQNKQKLTRKTIPKLTYSSFIQHTVYNVQGCKISPNEALRI